MQALIQSCLTLIVISIFGSAEVLKYIKSERRSRWSNRGSVSLCVIWHIFTSSSNRQMSYPETFGSSHHPGKKIVTDDVYFFPWQILHCTLLHKVSICLKNFIKGRQAVHFVC